jgi:mono/diheme cytochrome c family protein/Cu/Ag efflux protein CusF
MSLVFVPLHRAAWVGAGLTFLVACGPSRGGEVSEGRALYEAHCMACHGETARGDGPLASTLPIQPPSILEHLGHHTRAQLVQLISAGIPPAMPPAALSAEQIQTVVDYAWTLVPEDQVAALREMQAQAEALGGTPGTGSTPGVGGVGEGARAMPPAGAQEFAFAGSVQGVDAAAGTVSVLNDPVPGWMGSMTMSYAVDPGSVLGRLEPGDRITARVFAGDFRTLYGVEVAPR